MLKPSLLIQSALVVLCSFALLWTVPATADQPQAESVKYVYICGCGTDVGCNMVFAQPGNAPCGKPFIEKQVLREDADKVYVCACPGDCKCGLNQSDPAKCACGKELRAYPQPTGMRADCPHAMQPEAKQPPCAGCAKKPDCAGCPHAKPAEVQQPPCANCPKHNDCAGCPKMPVPEPKAPCSGCPQMPAADK
jgi:hypothetical protein